MFFLYSLRNRIRNRLWGKSTAAEDDDILAQDFPLAHVSNNDEDFADVAKEDIALPLQLVEIDKKTQGREQNDLKLSESDDGETKLELESQVYAKEAEKGKGKKGGGDFLADIFDQKSEENASLNHLAHSLPDVSMQELLKEAKEVMESMLQLRRGWMPKKNLYF